MGFGSKKPTWQLESGLIESHLDIAKRHPRRDNGCSVNRDESRFGLTR